MMVQQRQGSSALRVFGSVSRRRVIALMASGGAATGLWAIGALRLDTRRAYAHGDCASGACGPSPLCAAANCQSGNCKLSGASNWMGCRVYGSFTCVNPNPLSCSGNSWAESYCSPCKTTGTYTCADCCTDGAGGSGCLNCNWPLGTRACICRLKINNLC